MSKMIKKEVCKCCGEPIVSKFYQIHHILRKQLLNQAKKVERNIEKVKKALGRN